MIFFSDLILLLIRKENKYSKLELDVIGNERLEQRNAE
jgi:hypothetical protein